ncbi:MAG: hypothetical protein ACYTEW_21440 [Planctomycetota bacterium]|jgi:hypothetical protein
MLIFSTFKEPSHITWNAVSSWKLLTDRIILFGKECKPYEEEFDASILEPERKGKMPRVDSMFLQAQEYAEDGEVLIFVNSDIMLAPDVLGTTRMVQAQFEKIGFLIVGQRTNLDVKECLPFAWSGVWNMLRERAVGGHLLPACGADYFIYPRGFYKDIPPFAIARFSYDNWLIFDALKRAKPVVNATKMLLAIHQNHPEDNTLRHDTLSSYNQMLATRSHPDWNPWQGWVSHATVKL